MSIITNVSPNGTISGPIPNMPPQTLAPASAVVGAVQAAKPLLPNAVIASTLVPNYNEERAQNPMLPGSTVPSSQLAAQYIAQSPDASDDELAIFTPVQSQTPQAPQQNGATDDFLTALRTARGDVPQTAANSNIPQAAIANAAQQTNQAAANSNILNFAAQAAALATTARPTVRIEARNLPAPVSSAAGRKPGIAQSRGAGAYQIAVTRNESVISAGIDATL